MLGARKKLPKIVIMINTMISKDFKTLYLKLGSFKM